MATMSLNPLRRRIIEDMTLRNLSPSTPQSYVYAVAPTRSPAANAVTNATRSRRAGTASTKRATSSALSTSGCLIVRGPK
jgi:hypothetical protein